MKMSKGITKPKIKVFDNVKINQSRSTFVKYKHIREFHKDDQSNEEMNVDDDVTHLHDVTCPLDLTEQIKRVTSLDQLLHLINQPSYCFTADNIEDLIRLKKAQ